MENEEVFRKLKEKLAVTSTETLKRYYSEIREGRIPPGLSEFSELDLKIILKEIEEELSVRGEISKVKKIYIQ